MIKKDLKNTLITQLKQFFSFIPQKIKNSRLDWQKLLKRLINLILEIIFYFPIKIITTFVKIIEYILFIPRKIFFFLIKILKTPQLSVKNIFAFIVILIFTLVFIVFIKEMKKSVFIINDFSISEKITKEYSDKEYPDIDSNTIKKLIVSELYKIENEIKLIKIDKQTSEVQIGKIKKTIDFPVEFPNIIVKDINMSINDIYIFFKKAGLLKKVLNYDFLIVDGLITKDINDESLKVIINITGDMKDSKTVYLKNKNIYRNISLFILQYKDPICISDIYKYLRPVPDQLTYNEYKKLDEDLENPGYLNKLYENDKEKGIYFLKNHFNNKEFEKLRKDLNDEYYEKKQLRILQRIIKIWPDCCDAYYCLGRIYFENEKYELALPYFEKIINLKTESEKNMYTNTLNLIGCCYFKKSEYAESIIKYTEFIKLNKNNSVLYYNRAISLYYLSFEEPDKKNYHLKKAIRDTSKSIKLNTSKTQLNEKVDQYFNRAVYYYRYEDYKKAKKDYDSTIKLKSDFSEAYHNRAIVNDKLKNYEDAIADYNKAIKLKPKYINAFCGRALVYCHFKNSDFEKAISDAKKAIKLEEELVGVDNPFPYATLAEVYGYMNNDEKFYKILDKALQKKYPIKQAVEQEKVYKKYIHQQRFKDLLKKYKIKL